MTQTASNPTLVEIKNWDKYQSANCTKWIKDYTSKEDDPDFASLTMFQRALLEGLCRLRARMGQAIHTEVTYLSLALHIGVTDRPHVGHAIRTLISRGFLIPQNQQDNISEIDRSDKIRLDKKREEVVVESQKPALSLSNQNPADNDLVPLLNDMRTIYHHHGVSAYATWNTNPKDDQQIQLLSAKIGRQPLLLAFDSWCCDDACDQVNTKSGDGLAFPVRKFFNQLDHYVARSQDQYSVKRRSQPKACPVVRETDKQESDGDFSELDAIPKLNLDNVPELDTGGGALL
jgi:hypothetical protein